MALAIPGMTTKTRTQQPAAAPAGALKLAASAHFDVSALIADARIVDFTSIPMLPPSGFYGRDGRGPFTYDIALVVANVKANGADLPVFIDHKTQGEAYGWLDHTADPVPGADGGWEWPVRYTEAGLSLLQSSAFRYNSPGYWFIRDAASKAEAGEIISFSEVSFVAKPNLFLRSLNSEGADAGAVDAGTDGGGGYTGGTEQLESKNHMQTKLLALLGLAETATFEAASEAVASLHAAVAPAPGAVPEAVVEAAVHSRIVAGALVDAATHAEVQGALTSMTAARDAALAELTAHTAAAHEAAAVAAVDAAISGGKYTPASRAALLKQARADIASFSEVVASMPVHPAVSGVLAVATQSTDVTFGLSAEQVAICKQNGISPEIYAKTLRTAAKA